MGVFLSSLSKVCLGFLSLARVVRPSLPQKPQWLYLVRLVKMSQFSVERKGSSKDKRHWKEPPLTSHPALCFLHEHKGNSSSFPCAVCCSHIVLCLQTQAAPLCCSWPPRRPWQPSPASSPLLATSSSVD